jgi:hypothetical protein
LGGTAEGDFVVGEDLAGKSKYERNKMVSMDKRGKKGTVSVLI